MDIMRRVTRCCKLITTIALLSTSSTPANAGHFPEEQRPLPYITLSREQNPQILFPAHGLILNPTYDTNPNAEGLQVKGVGIAPLGYKVWVNNFPAEIIRLQSSEPRRLSPHINVLRQNNQTKFLCGGLETRIHPEENNLFTFDLNINSPATELELFAQRPTGAFLTSTSFLYDKNPEKTYTITIDDVADTFAEIAEKKPASIFEHTFFQRLQQLHQKYNTAFSLYLFEKGTLYPYFNLSQMPARYQQEFQENASWLRLGFHARQMLPSHPYKNADSELATRDFVAVKKQVLRFAGEKSWDAWMRSHYWSGSLESCRAWGLLGIQRFYAAPAGRQAYYLPSAINALLAFHDGWYDFQEAKVFLQTDLWIEHDFPQSRNHAETIARKMEEYLLNYPLALQNLHIFTHEAFILIPNTTRHQVPEKMQALVAWLTQQGYQPRSDASNPFLQNLPQSRPYHLVKETRAGQEQLIWEHQSQEKCQYHISKRSLTHPAQSWQPIGETQERYWNIETKNERESYAYRVTSINEQGLQSNSQPLIVNPPPLSEELTFTTHPNPFNQKTTIHYSVPHAGRVSITLYSLIGQTIYQFPPQQQTAGQYRQEFNAEGLASGVYIIHLEAGNQKANKKIVVVK